jgi:hypothetical protein
MRCNDHKKEMAIAAMKNASESALANSHGLPWTSRLLEVLLAMAAGLGIRVLVSGILFGSVLRNYWFSWHPGSTVARCLLETPIEWMASEVKWFISLHSPESVLLFIVGVLLGRWRGKRSIPLMVILAVAFAMASSLYKVNMLWFTVRCFLGRDIQQGTRYGVFSTLIYGSLLMGTLVGAWWYRRRTPILYGHCTKCGYNLTGLPENRCPECGKAFGVRSSNE